MRGLVVPLEVMPTMERPSAPRLEAVVIAYVVVDALDVGLEALTSGESCREQLLTIMYDNVGHLLASQSWIVQEKRPVVSCFGRFVFG